MFSPVFSNSARGACALLGGFADEAKTAAVAGSASSTTVRGVAPIIGASITLWGKERAQQHVAMSGMQLDRT
jgi:hypothetical protein